ncbi:MAG: hypothetical protein ACT4P1_13300 [Sporichthyaceae bacterium]
MKVRALLLLALVFAAIPLLGVSAAQACDCAQPTDAAALDRASHVFTADLDDTVYPEKPPEASSSLDPAIYTFSVDRVFKGDVVEDQRVRSVRDGASCGLELRGDGPFLVFASTREPPPPGVRSEEEAALPYAGLCNGTRANKAGEMLTIGSGASPAPPATPEPTETALAAGPGNLENDYEDDMFPDLSSGVIALLAVGGLVGVGVRRRRSR